MPRIAKVEPNEIELAARLFKESGKAHAAYMRARAAAPVPEEEKEDAS